MRPDVLHGLGRLAVGSVVVVRVAPLRRGGRRAGRRRKAGGGTRPADHLRGRRRASRLD